MNYRLLASLAIVAIIGLSYNVALGAAVIGIDFGSRFMKIALVKPGRPFEIVLNPQSKRKTDSVFAVNDGERLYGLDASGLATRKPRQVLFRLRELLGRSVKHPAVCALDDELIKYTVETRDGSGTIEVNLEHGMDEDYRSLLLVEELVAMLLQYARDISAEYGETPVKDCVITVPAFFTQQERVALLDAAQIAGINVLSLIEENTAAALQYGIDRVYTDTAHKMLVYNMGALSTQVSIYEYTGKEIKRGSSSIQQGEFRTLSKYWDASLGGDAFDRILFEQFATEFDEKYPGSNIRDQPRAVARLRKIATKTKEVLSANMETPVTVESLHDGKDFRSGARRENFEKSAAQFVDRITKPIDVALNAANMTIADIDGIELIGGGTRVPLVKRALTEYFGEMELGNHLNGDESMALGAVFHGANLSTAFRVRHVGMAEISTYPVGVRLSEIEPAENEEDVWSKQATLFKRFSNLVARKVVTFQHDKDISCDMAYEVAEDALIQLPEGTKPELVSYDITGIAEANNTHGHLGKPKVSLTFALDVSGVSKLAKAEAIFTEMIEVQVPVKKSKKKDEAEKNDEEEKSEEQKDETTEDAATTEEEASTEENSETDDVKEEDTPNEGEAATDDAKEEEEKEEFTTELKKKIHKIPLTIVEKQGGIRRITDDDKKEAKKLLEDWHAKDLARKKHQSEMNALESFVFESRDRIRSNDEIVELVSTEEEVEKLLDDLMEVEDWLYEDEGQNADIKEYKRRKAALQKRVNQIFIRAKELEERPVAVEETVKLFSTIREQVKVWETERPWIAEAQRAAFLERVAGVEAWLNEMVDAQSKLTPRDAPAFMSNDIRVQLEPVQRALEKLLKKRKPKAKKPKKTEEEKKEEEETKESESENQAEEEPKKEEEIKEEE